MSECRILAAHFSRPRPDSELVRRPPRLNRLRDQIRSNRMSFPAQAPILTGRHYRADIQWRVVELYFIHGWASARIAARYNVGEKRIHQLLREWTRRAIDLGYLQEIPSADELWPPEAPEQAMPPGLAAGATSDRGRGAVLSGRGR